jgi:hypothetical protein
MMISNVSYKLLYRMRKRSECESLDNRGVAVTCNATLTSGLIFLVSRSWRNLSLISSALMDTTMAKTARRGKIPFIAKEQNEMD